MDSEHSDSEGGAELSSHSWSVENCEIEGLDGEERKMVGDVDVYLPHRLIMNLFSCLTGLSSGNGNSSPDPASWRSNCKPIDMIDDGKGLGEERVKEEG